MHTIHGFGKDIELTTKSEVNSMLTSDLVAPIPGSQSYALRAGTIRAKSTVRIRFFRS